MTSEVRAMKRDTQNPQQRRRHFLKASAVMGAGTAAVALVPGLVSATEAPEAQGEPATEAGHKGYQLSQHVLDYYRTARI
jgi:nitrous oxide reductase